MQREIPASKYPFGGLLHGRKRKYGTVYARRLRILALKEYEGHYASTTTAVAVGDVRETSTAPEHTLR